MWVEIHTGHKYTQVNVPPTYVAPVTTSHEISPMRCYVPKGWGRNKWKNRLKHSGFPSWNCNKEINKASKKPHRGRRGSQEVKHLELRSLLV